jgi:hypothetical protein
MKSGADEASSQHADGCELRGMMVRRRTVCFGEKSRVGVSEDGDGLTCSSLASIENKPGRAGSNAGRKPVKAKPWNDNPPAPRKQVNSQSIHLQPCARSRPAALTTVCLIPSSYPPCPCIESLSRSHCCTPILLIPCVTPSTPCEPYAGAGPPASCAGAGG